MGDAVRRYLVYALLLWRSSRRWCLVGGLVAVASGLLPVAAILASGALIGAVPGLVGDGLSSSSGHRAVGALAIFVAALVATSAMEMLRAFVSQVLTSRYLLTVHDLLATASLGPDQIGHLEDPYTARRLEAVTEAMREGGFLDGVNSTIVVVSMRLFAGASAVVLVTFRWWAPILLMIAWFMFSWAFNKWLATLFDELVEVTGSERRRAEYMRSLLMSSDAAKEVRIFGLQSYLGHRFASSWLTTMEAVWRNRRRTVRPLGLAILALILTHALVLTVLGNATVQGTVSLGEIAVFLQAITALSSFGMLGDPLTELSRSTTLARHIKEIAVNSPSLTSGPTDVHHVPATGAASVELCNVSFTYGARENPTLHDLSLSIPAGQSVAIVGENGTGKSTLIKLLCGLYSPQTGNVRIDSVPLSDSALDVVRGRVAVIFQGFVQYQLSLRDNIGFGRLEAKSDEETLRRAIIDAGGQTILERLDLGFDTVLSAEYENGTDLSGGQWQRVALARALMALGGGAGLLILDEPTAALDVRAEAELFQRFLHVTRGVTTLLVSHRLSSVRHADRILVLADGRIVEDGSHDELISLNGRYARMFSLQAQRFAETGNTDGSRRDHTIVGDSDA